MLRGHARRLYSQPLAPHHGRSSTWARPATHPDPGGTQAAYQTGIRAGVFAFAFGDRREDLQKSERLAQCPGTYRRGRGLPPKAPSPVVKPTVLLPICAVFVN